MKVKRLDLKEYLAYRRRYKSIYSTAIYINAGADLTRIASGVAATTTLVTGIGFVASVPLGFTAVATCVLGVISTGVSKIVLKKVEKHEQIKSIAAAKLSSINGLVSTALQNSEISHEEYQIILQMDSYRDYKSQIRHRITAEIRELTVEKENEIREESFEKRDSPRSRSMSNFQNMMKI